MAEIIDRDTRERIALEHEQAILAAQHVEVLARFVVFGSARQRPAQVDSRLQLARLKRDQRSALPLGRHLHQLVTKHQGRIADRLTQPQTPPQGTCAGIEFDQLIDNERRRPARSTHQ